MAGADGWGSWADLHSTITFHEHSFVGPECLKAGKLASLEGKHLLFTATALGGYPWYLEPVLRSQSKEDSGQTGQKMLESRGMLETLRDVRKSRARVVK